MRVSAQERSNERWLAELRGPARDGAIADLRLILVRGLEAALHGPRGSFEALAEDSAQEALIKILDNLDSFRGDSHFVVWAQKIAVRTAFAEMRRRPWHDVSLDEAILSSEPVAATAAEDSDDPELEAERHMIMAQFRRFIDEELTDRQGRALLAALGGMPLEEIARRLGTNRNALYKLLHDARKKLKRRMISERMMPEDVLSVFGGR